MTLEQRIESAAGSLPPGWQINIEVENGSGLVRAIRPDKTFVIMGDGDDTIDDQFRDALALAHDETEADKHDAEMDGIRSEQRAEDAECRHTD